MPHMANLPWMQTYFILPTMIMLFLQKSSVKMMNKKSLLKLSKNMEKTNKWSW